MSVCPYVCMSICLYVHMSVCCDRIGPTTPQLEQSIELFEGKGIDPTIYHDIDRPFGGSKLSNERAHFMNDTENDMNDTETT